MDIFKLFFNHDQRLDKLAKRNANKTSDEVEASLADFMKPDPTYSKFYLTGTRLQEEQFGINVLEHYDEIMAVLEKVFLDQHFFIKDQSYSVFREVVDSAKIGDAIVFSPNEHLHVDTSGLDVDEESNVGHFKEALSDVLKDGHMVLYKEQAHNGFDLHLFSKDNIYKQLFFPLQQLVGNPQSFRFFSINSKRMRSEKHFYFETWTLDKPPHGAEEVLPETVL